MINGGNVGPVGRRARAAQGLDVRARRPRHAARASRRSPPPANEYGVDPFGFDLDYAVAAVAPFALALPQLLPRRGCTASSTSPRRAASLLVANHSGQLPFDGAMIGVALLLETRPAARRPRAGREVGPDAAVRLHLHGALRPDRRHAGELPPAARRRTRRSWCSPRACAASTSRSASATSCRTSAPGFMRLALETDTPIVPVAVVGAEEQAPALLNLKPLAQLLGFPALPAHARPGSRSRCPTRYRIYFGEPLRFTGLAGRRGRRARARRWRR